MQNQTMDAQPLVAGSLEPGSGKTKAIEGQLGENPAAKTDSTAEEHSQKASPSKEPGDAKKGADDKSAKLDTKLINAIRKLHKREEHEGQIPVEAIIDAYDKVTPKKAIEGPPQKFEFTKIRYEKAGTTKRVYYVEQKRSFVVLTMAEPERPKNSKIEADQKAKEDKAGKNE